MCFERNFMKKSVFAKRVLTVVLAATMVLSNSSAAFAEAPSTPVNDTVIVTETGFIDPYTVSKQLIVV